MPRSRASVDSSISARVIDCTSLYWSSSRESKPLVLRDGLQLVARGHAADVDGILEFEQALLDGAVAFDEFPRMAAGGFQFLLEFADLDGDFADHAHQVVEQLRGHARHGACLAIFGVMGAAAVIGAGPAASAAVEAGASAIGREIVVTRRVQHFDDGQRVVGWRVLTGDRGHHLRQAVGRGHQRARTMFGRSHGVGFADLEHVLEAMRELADAADAQDVGRALERMRGALGIQQQVGLRRRGDPAGERLRHFRRLRRRVVHERVDEGGIHVARDVERQVGGGERFGRGVVGLVERGADGAGREQLAAQLGKRLGFQRQRHPATAKVFEQGIDRSRARWRRADAPRAAAPIR